MEAIDADVLAVADGFGVRLRSVESNASVRVSQVEAVKRARPLVPSRSWLCSLDWRHAPDRGTRTAWWLVQDDVDWQPTQRTETVHGMSVKAIDAETGEVLVEGVWGSAQ